MQTFLWNDPFDYAAGSLKLQGPWTDSSYSAFSLVVHQAGQVRAEAPSLTANGANVALAVLAGWVPAGKWSLTFQYTSASMTDDVSFVALGNEAGVIAAVTLDFDQDILAGGIYSGVGTTNGEEFLFLFSAGHHTLTITTDITGRSTWVNDGVTLITNGTATYWHLLRGLNSSLESVASNTAQAPIFNAINITQSMLWGDGFAYANGNLIGKGSWAASSFAALSPAVTDQIVTAGTNNQANGTAAKWPNALLGVDVSKPFSVCIFWQNLKAMRTFGTEYGGLFIGDTDGSANGFYAAAEINIDNTVTANHAAVDISDSNGNTAAATAVASDLTSHTLLWSVNGSTTTLAIDRTLVATTTLIDYSQLQVYDATLDLSSNTTDNAALGIISILVDATPLTISASTVKSGADVVLTFALSNPAQASSFKVSRDGGAYTTQTTPHTYAGDASAKHTYSVRAYDVSGNILATGSGIYYLPADVNRLLLLDAL